MVQQEKRTGKDKKKSYRCSVWVASITWSCSGIYFKLVSKSTGYFQVGGVFLFLAFVVET